MPRPILILTMIFAAILGMCVFSFLNVVAFRLPRGQSFVHGASHCPSCGRRLSPWELIPIFGFLILRGHCRTCGAKIPCRDTLMELLGGIAAVCCAWMLSDIGQMLSVFCFFSILALVAMIDADTMTIPNGCCLLILLLAFISVFTMPQISWLSRLIGSICVSLPMLLLAMVIPGAFGGGDIKLMAASGLFLGWKITLLSSGFAVIIGGLWCIIALARHRIRRKDFIPFGPFLCIGMAVALLWGEPLLTWYFHLFGL